MSFFYGGILALLLIPVSGQSAALDSKIRPECRQNRAAFQFGPYVTRMVVAEVDICQNRIGRLLESWELELPFEDFLEGEDDRQKFPERFLRKAIHAIWLLRKKSDPYQPQMRLALVSPLLRRVSNGPQLLNYFEHVGKLRVVEAEARELAEMNYHAVIQALHRESKPRVAVWDIGASQMSMVVPDINNQLNYYLDNMAAITFRNWMIANIYKKKVKDLATPNPIGTDNSIAALDFVKTYANSKILPNMRKLLKDRTLIGVGGVHTHILGKMDGLYRKIDRRMLGREIRDLRQYTDRGLGGGRFASTKVSNMIMVLGHMESLGIDEYYVINTNPLVGLLLMNQI